MKPPEEAAREMAGEWLAKADADLRACDELLSTAALSEIAAFHAQQAAEKALKAFLVWNQVEFPKTHDIKRLLALCRSVDSGLAESLGDAAQLTPYGVEYRYPGEYPTVPAAAANDSVALARKVLAEVLRSLPDELRR